MGRGRYQALRQLRAFTDWGSYLSQWRAYLVVDWDFLFVFPFFFSHFCIIIYIELYIHIWYRSWLLFSFFLLFFFSFLLSTEIPVSWHLQDFFGTQFTNNPHGVEFLSCPKYTDFLASLTCPGIYNKAPPHFGPFLPVSSKGTTCSGGVRWPKRYKSQLWRTWKLGGSL